MTRAIRASEHGLEPHWKVRVVLPGAILHLAARTEPVVSSNPLDGGALSDVDADWITDPDYGDTLGFIDWTKVAAITWRYSP